MDPSSTRRPVVAGLLPLLLALLPALLPRPAVSREAPPEPRLLPPAAGAADTLPPRTPGDDTLPPRAPGADTLPSAATAADTLPGAATAADTLPGAATAADTVPAAALFPGVRHITLDEAVEIAMRRSPALRQSRANVDLAEYRRLGSFGDFLPQLSLGYGYSDASTGRLDPTGQTITRTAYTVQLGGSIDLFTGFRRMHDLDAARRELEAQRSTYREQRLQTVEQVTAAYYNAIANRQIVEVEAARVRRQQDQLRFVQSQLDLGRATRSDLLRSQVELNNARLALLQARNQARASTFELARVLGVGERVAPDTAAGLRPDSLVFDREELIRLALEAGPSVRAAEADAQAARARAEASKASYWPNLRLTGGWAWQNTEFPPGNRSWSVALQGSYPLFNGFQRETAVFQAQTQVELAEAREEAARLQLRADVDAAYSTLQTARAGIDLALRSVELSREDLEVTRERYRLGLATILDLQTAQINLRQAQVELIQRRFDHLLAVARLEALLGRPVTEGA